jgi:hypothetical protein
MRRERAKGAGPTCLASILYQFTDLDPDGERSNGAIGVAKRKSLAL